MEKTSLPQPNLKSKFIKYLYLFYRCAVSPYLGANCRFYPTCSSYCYQAYVNLGWKKAFWLGFKRILKCHPWHVGGYDPL